MINNFYELKSKKYSKLIVLIFLFLLFSSGCTRQNDRDLSFNTRNDQESNKLTEKTLTVMAASSLAGPFQKIGSIFEERNPNVDVVFNFAGSQQLASQIINGASADLFASANIDSMKKLVDSGKVNNEDIVLFAENSLIIIVPWNNPANLQSFKDLAQPNLKIVLGDSNVPVGQYSIQILENVEQDPFYGVNFKPEVLNNVVSYESNVKAIVAKVKLGEADAGIVYISDALSESSDTIKTIVIPEDHNVLADYPIVILGETKNRELSGKFLDLLVSDTGERILNDFGFVPNSDFGVQK